MKIPYFDAHCDTLSRMAYLPGAHLERRTGQWDLEKLSRFDGPKAQIFAVFYDSALPGASRAAERQIAVVCRECERNQDRVVSCVDASQAEQAFADGKLAAFLSVEGAELLDCAVGKLDWAYARGVRFINLTWNHANALSGSHCDESERGLSGQGRDFVRRMEQLGMLPDVSHLSDAGFWDLAECINSPIIASHSNSRSVFFHTRNLTDEQFTAIIKKNGIVGLNCYAAFLGEGSVTMDDLRRHLDHFLALGGEKTVALGGDWDGCDRLPAGFAGNWSWLDFYEYLLRANYAEDLLQDLYFNNLMRTVRAVCTI